MQGGFEWARSRVRVIGRPAPGQKETFLELEPDNAYLINPGSVGQPRDGDPRTAYVLYNPEDKFLIYRRVSYDITTAQGKIYNAELPDILAHRLAVGR